MIRYIFITIILHSVKHEIFNLVFVNGYLCTKTLWYKHELFCFETNHYKHDKHEVVEVVIISYNNQILKLCNFANCTNKNLLGKYISSF